MSGTLISPLPIQQFFDNNGAELTGGKLFTYVAGTTTKQATYTDSTGATPNTNPIILNARGEANVWLTAGAAYKFILSPSTDTDPPTNSIWTVDQISGGISAIPDQTLLGNSSGGTALPTGQSIGFGLVLAGGVLSSVVQNFIAGLTLSNDGSFPNTTLDIAAGSATDTSDTVVMTIGNFTKLTQGPWSAGSGNNGMGVGLTATLNTWYHVHIILNNGNSDVYFDTSITAANAPVGTTAYRRIGSILLDGSINILPFAQVGNRFFWRTPRKDIVSNTSVTSGSNLTLTLPSVPPGINAYASLRILTINSTNAGTGFAVMSGAETVNPGVSYSISNPVAGIDAFTQLDVLVSINQTVLMVSNQASNNTVNIWVVSWVDTLGTL